MIVFTNLTVGGLQTHLYAPNQSADDGGFLLFLLPGEDLPGSFTLDETWGSSAPIKGFYLFLNRVPATDLLLKFDQLILEALGGAALENSNFAWIQVDKSAVPKIVAQVATGIDTNNAVVVSRRVTIPAPQPYSSIPLNEGTPVVGLAGEGGIASFVFEYPPVPPIKGQPASGPPNGVGLILPCTGQGRGCLRSEALYGGESDSANEVVKNLYLVSLDPLAPFDSNRTYLTITNESFRLIESEGVIGIAPN